ncbi:hypothetical protein EV359DRAFT_59568 [Lentinula novae-zelandiae]|nr:hypothetical protein EV359DRAFT_59568 [Lentinula novae-zelandiae]
MSIIQEPSAAIPTNLKRFEESVKQREIPTGNFTSVRRILKTAGTPHQLPAMSQNNTSESFRLPEDGNDHTNLLLSTDTVANSPSSSHSFKNTDGRDPRSLGRKEARFSCEWKQPIHHPFVKPQASSSDCQNPRAAKARRGNQTCSGHPYSSNQPPPANFKLTPLSQESSIHSDEDDPFDNLPLTPPTSQRYKRSRDQESNEESEPDSSRSSPSRNKGKKKANLAYDWITPTTSTKDDTDVFTASTQLVGIIGSLEELRGQVLKLERQMKALRKSNEAKLEKIRDLETDNHSLKLENDQCVPCSSWCLKIQCLTSTLTAYEEEYDSWKTIDVRFL